MNSHSINEIVHCEPIETMGINTTKYNIFSDLDCLDFSSLSIQSNENFWVNYKLNDIVYGKYVSLSDDEIIKFGTVWLFEYFSGDFLGMYWFAEWTLILALQISLPNDDSKKLFSDFLVNPGCMELNFYKTYERQYENLIGKNLIEIINMKRVDGFDSTRLFTFLSDNHVNHRLKANLICFIALYSFKCCSMSYSFHNYEKMFCEYYIGSLEKSAIGSPHYKIVSILGTIFNIGSFHLRTILVPCLTIWAHFDRNLIKNETNALISEMLNECVLSTFRFKGLHPIELYENACKKLQIFDGSLLKRTFEPEFATQYERLQSCHKEYAEPKRSLYPWARCLDPSIMNHFEMCDNSWICWLMSTVTDDLYKNYPLFAYEGIDKFDQQTLAIEKGQSFLIDLHSNN
ncbi:hypothetical protein RDWZM_003659 [Blomia tropicalis]|uniref:Uncharacterized protein n=1 Tax=Blomia tropicalis TaxID=40697 RepID=A0A9Q0RSR6_BLOTA|nr:hypothetical protein RDWZM_003659 [Blomia tropicalis]